MNNQVSVIKAPKCSGRLKTRVCDWSVIPLCGFKLKFHWDQFPRNFPVANVTGKSPTSYGEVGDVANKSARKLRRNWCQWNLSFTVQSALTSEQFLPATSIKCMAASVLWVLAGMRNETRRRECATWYTPWWAGFHWPEHCWKLASLSSITVQSSAVRLIDSWWAWSYEDRSLMVIATCHSQPAPLLHHVCPQSFY